MTYMEMLEAKRYLPEVNLCADVENASSTFDIRLNVKRDGVFLFSTGDFDFLANFVREEAARLDAIDA